MNKSITERIRERYCTSGEWVTTQSKLEEAKLLKEACLYIEKLERLKNSVHNDQHNLFQE